MDFPTWYNVGSYGGLILSMLTALGITAYALGLRRGTRRQQARATQLCLMACVLMFASIFWSRHRLDFLGPKLPVYEVTFWLAWTALAGWCAPLALAALYLVRAAPQPVTASLRVPAAAGRVSNPPLPSRGEDPRRQIEPLGAGVAWGKLVPVVGIFAERTLALSQQMTLLGRQADCDIVVPDGRASRHHAELRWDHGVISLVDLDSANGTRVNGQRVIGQTPMRDGDVLTIGAHHYRLQLVQVAPSEPTNVLGEAGGPETSKVPGTARSGGSRPNRTEPIILAAESGAARGKHWELRGQLSVIGRGAEYAVNLPDGSVSRPHAQLIWQAAGVYVQDLDSVNGTHLNGVRLTEPTRLRESDLLLVGEVSLRCVALGAATAATGQPDISTLATTALGSAAASQAPDISTMATDALNLAPPATGRGPDLHMRMAPRPYPVDRPHLAPPRLLPSLDPPIPPDDD